MTISVINPGNNIGPAPGFTLDANTFALYRCKETVASNYATFVDAKGRADLTAHAGTNRTPYGPGADPIGITNANGNPYAKVFAGTGQYAEGPGDAGTPAALKGAARTFRAWVYLTTLASTQYILTFGGTGEIQPVNNLVFWYVDATGQQGLILEHGAGVNSTWASTGDAIPLNTWTHVAIVITSAAGVATVTFYLNGVAQTGSAPQTDCDGGDDATCRWDIAVNGTAHSGWYTGRMKGVAFDTVARTPVFLLAEAQDATMTLVDDADTYDLWAMSESPDWIDATDNGIHLKEWNAPLQKLTETPTQGGRYWPTGGSNEAFASVLSEINPIWYGEVTVEAWVRLGDAFAAILGLFVFGDPGPETQPENFLGSFEFTVAYGGTSWWEFGAGLDSVYNVPAFLDADTAKVRHYVALVKRLNGGGPTYVVDFYLDGVLLGTSGALTNCDGGTTSWMRIGKGNAEAPFYGVLETLRFSSVARTQAEITQQYQNGLGVGT